MRHSSQSGPERGRAPGRGRHRAVHRPLPQGAHRRPRRGGHPECARRPGGGAGARKAQAGHPGQPGRARAADRGTGTGRPWGRDPGRPGGRLPAVPSQEAHPRDHGPGAWPGASGPEDPVRRAGPCGRGLRVRRSGQGRAGCRRRPGRRAGHHRRNRERGAALPRGHARPVRRQSGHRLVRAQGQGRGRAEVPRLFRLAGDGPHGAGAPHSGHAARRARKGPLPVPAPRSRRRPGKIGPPFPHPQGALQRDCAPGHGRRLCPASGAVPGDGVVGRAQGPFRRRSHRRVRRQPARTAAGPASGSAPRPGRGPGPANRRQARLPGRAGRAHAVANRFSRGRQGAGRGGREGHPRPGAGI